jgi:hypothetical protein
MRPLLGYGGPGSLVGRADGSNAEWRHFGRIAPPRPPVVWDCPATCRVAPPCSGPAGVGEASTAAGATKPVPRPRACPPSASLGTTLFLSAVLHILVPGFAVRVSRRARCCGRAAGRVRRDAPGAGAPVPDGLAADPRAAVRLAAQPDRAPAPRDCLTGGADPDRSSLQRRLRQFAQAALSTPSTPDRSSWSRLPQASPRRARQHRSSPQHQRRQPLPSGRGARRSRRLPSLDRG